MNYNNSLSMRDLKKNLDNVRLDLILDAVASSEINKSPRDEDTKASLTRLYIKTQQLNAEELSLLVDSAPNSSHGNGQLVCTWRLGQQFTRENESNLGSLLSSKLKTSIENVYEQRMALASGAISVKPSLVEAQPEDIFSRLINKLSKPRQQESVFGLG